MDKKGKMDTHCGTEGISYAVCLSYFRVMETQPHHCLIFPGDEVDEQSYLVVTPLVGYVGLSN